MRTESLRRIWALVQGMPHDAVTWLAQQQEPQRKNVVSVSQFKQMLES